ncbi:MAG: hypothetical protein Q9227_009199, partial [Pyrenula ochraceoflavens]
MTGYGQAAVILQRDWNRDPQSLSFVKHVKDHALVGLVQQGLQYYHLKQTLPGPNGEMLPLDPSQYYFGAESARPITQPAPKRESGDETGIDLLDPSASAKAPTRKHARESGPNGIPMDLAPGQPAPKRSRKTNATNNPANSERITNGEQHDTTTNNMDIDSAGTNLIANGYPAAGANYVAENGNAEPGVAAKSPTTTTEADREASADNDMDVQAGANHHASAQEHQITHTLTNGHSVGVQITPAPAKIKDLRHDSTILDVAQNNHVMQAMWRPRDSSVLAAWGDQYAGVWKSKGSGEVPSFQSFLDEDDSVIVTAAAWHPSGSALAVATYSDQASQLVIYEGDTGAMSSNNTISRNMVTSLRWSNVGSRIAASVSDGKEFSLILWDLSSPESGFLSIATTEPILDLSWSINGNSSILCAAGEGVIYQCRATGAEFLVERRLESPAPSNTDGKDAWSFIRVPWFSEETATIITASTDSARLWVPTHDFTSDRIHKGDISALELSSSSASSPFPSPTSTYDFATASADGSIRLWRFDTAASTLSCLQRLTMGEATPVYAMAFSPDGSLVAGAHRDTVNIWEVGRLERGGAPMGRWEGAAAGWKIIGDIPEKMTSTVNGAEREVNGDSNMELDVNGENEELEHCLSWDEEGGKVAFALGSQ